MYSEEKELMYNRLKDFQKEWRISFPAEKFLTNAFIQEHQNFDKVKTWEDFENVSVERYFEWLDDLQSPYGYDIIKKVFGCNYGKKGVEYKSPRSFLKDIRKYNFVIIIFMNRYKNDLYGQGIHLILVPDDIKLNIYNPSTLRDLINIKKDSLKDFNVSLHKKFWNYIADNKIPEPEALEESLIKGILTKSEYYEISNSFNKSLSCQYCCDNLNEKDRKTFMNQQYSSLDIEICKKGCPFKISGDTCMDGLYNRYFDNFDYEYGHPKIFNEKEWEDVAKAIANFPVKDGIKVI